MNREMQNLWLTLCGKGVSQMGSKLFGFAMSFYILKMTGSAQSFAVSLLITTLPAILISPFAGALADRMNKKFIVVGADFISGLSMLAFFMVIRETQLTVTHIYIASFILSLLFVFLNNAFGAAYPNIVSKDKLTLINAYSQGLDSVLSILTPILGGIIYALVDIRLFFLINGISFILSALSEWFIDFQMFGHATYMQSAKSSFMQNMKEGFAYVVKQKTFMTIAIYALFINFFLSSFTIIMPYNLITLHGVSPETNGMIQALFPIGAILMSIYVGKKNIKFSQSIFRNTMLMFGMLMIAFAVPVLPSVDFGPFVSFYYAALMCLLAMVVILVNVPLQVMYQTTLDDAYRGRAMGVLSTFAQGIMPISYILTGVLMDVIPSFSILIFNAFALMLIAFSIQKNSRLKVAVA